MSLFPSFRNAVSCSEPNFRNIAKNRIFTTFDPFTHGKLQDSAIKNFIPVDSKLNEGYNLKFLY